MVGGARRFSLVSVSLEPTGEGNSEGVRHGPPPHQSQCPSAAATIKGPGGEVEAFRPGGLPEPLDPRIWLARFSRELGKSFAYCCGDWILCAGRSAGSTVDTILSGESRRTIRQQAPVRRSSTRRSALLRDRSGPCRVTRPEWRRRCPEPTALRPAPRCPGTRIADPRIPA